MRDLKIKYKDSDGQDREEVYSTIMDFTDIVDDGSHSCVGTAVMAEFFENPLLSRSFPSLKDLYLHCQVIVK